MSHPAPELRPRPVTLESRALDNLRYIATDRGVGFTPSQECERFEIANA